MTFRRRSKNRIQNKIVFTLFPKKNPPFRTIQISRGLCNGLCPDYSAVIHSDGKVEYKGKEFVKTEGEENWQMDEEQLNDLNYVLRKADFANLELKYNAWVHSLPACSLEVDFSNGFQKTLREGPEFYIPEVEPMPVGNRVFYDLLQEIEEISGISYRVFEYWAIFHFTLRNEGGENREFRSHVVKARSEEEAMSLLSNSTEVNGAGGEKFNPEEWNVQHIGEQKDNSSFGNPEILGSR